MKIVTITLNPSVDKNVQAGIVLPGKKIRCQDPREEPGGGGINVSRALKKLGVDSTAIFFSGGATGKKLNKLLEEEGITTDPVEISGETRENIIVQDESINQMYRFGMPGSPAKEEEWKNLLLKLENLDESPEFIVASGSLPPGVPTDFYAMVGEISARKNAKFILDTSGEGLTKATGKNLFLVKPNLNELASLMGVEEVTAMEQEQYAEKAIKEGQSQVIVVSMGAKGAMFADENQIAYYLSPTVKKNSPVGAGDSMVAGIVYGLVNGFSHKDAVQYGVASGTAATMTPGTELCRKEDTEKIYQWIHDKVMVES